MEVHLENTNVTRQERLITPDELKTTLPVGDALEAAVNEHRRAVDKIVQGKDHRLLIVTGPCSIHDPVAAREYAKRLALLADELSGELLIVMRAYFEKPRTTIGWKGLINDPHLDDSFRIDDGFRIARQLLLDLARLGLPLATEALDPITPQYLHDLISWSAIGARTTESQTHREMASGLSSAVGFKNGTDGSLETAINALKSVATPHRFLGINASGEVSVFHTRGNANAHIVLRGGSNGPNYDAANVRRCEAQMKAAGLSARIMIDCSHANSSKDHNRQVLVAKDVATQIEQGNTSIIGLMVESHLHAGNQPMRTRDQLRYGVSVTDACVDWETTESLLRELASRVQPSLLRRVA
ncbi:MAG: 3-deoxy-7-phosphoheptulonate synthase [Gammaproteobacteria bacterium]|nr:3-deoxy-7-phosphoheptulonate synthase [Gammaproteobacteria bacterium]